jgi:PAS domain S-box-containing protein
MSAPNAPDLSAENAELRARLAEAEATLEAIRTGGVDALVTAGPEGDQVSSLQGAETPFRLLVESMNGGAATLAPDGTILYCNHRFAEMVATPAERVIGSCLWQWVVSAQEPIVRSLVATAQHAGARAELSFSAPAGPELPVLLSLRPIQMDSHSIGVVAADLTERKRAEESLRQANESLVQRVAARTEELQRQREWLSGTLGSIGDALIATDAAGRVSLLNPVAETLTGWSREEVLGQPIQSVFRIVDETTRIPGDDIVGRVLREGAPIKLANNSCLIARAGHEVPIEDSAAPIKDSDGKVTGAVLVFHDVSEKRPAQRALQQSLRESEERFRSVVENMSEGLMLFDAQGMIYQNPASLRIHGFKGPEEMRIEHKELPTTWEGWDETGRPIPFEEWPVSRVLRHERFQDQVLRAVRVETGREFYGSYNGSPILGADGKLTLGFITVRDITERKRMEGEIRRRSEELRQSEALLRSITDNSPDPIFLKDRASRLLLANPATLAALHKRSEDVLGKTDVEFYDDPAIGRLMIANDRRVMESGQTEVIEEVVPSSTGPRTFLSAKTPYRDSEGHVIGIIGVSRDITDRKRAEEALRKSEALAISEKEFRLLAESMPQIVWATRADGWNTYFNQQWVDYTGLTLEESCGHGWNKPFHPDDQQRAWDAWQDAVTNRATYGLECRLRRTDGTYRWWLIRGVPVLDEKGIILKWFGTCTDINDFKEAEKALLEAGEERLRLVLEATSMGTFEVDLRTGEGRWNTVEFELLGLKPGDASSVPATFFRYLHPDDVATVQAQWAEATQTGILNTEFRIVRADGQVRWLAGLGRFAYAGKPRVSAPEGKPEPERFLGVNFDITERKQLEATLRESESRYRAIGESIDYGVWVCAPDGRNIYASSSFLKLVGLTQEQCSNFGWGDVLHPDDTARTVVAWNECVRTGANWDIEHRFRGVDGKYHPVLARGVPVRNDRGEIVC